MKNTIEERAPKKNDKILGMTLVDSILITFSKELFRIFMFGFVVTTLELFQPTLSYSVINYIKDDNKDIKSGLTYFIGIFITTLLISLSTTLLWYYFTILGFNLSNTFSLLIYNKALRHPLIT
jgi:ABC-type multidrug transport system fused ATPase/permease subunit